MGALLLLADSQLLFREDKAPELHRRVKTRFPHTMDAAYIGAANGDDPTFYELACEGIRHLLGRDGTVRWVRPGAELPLPCPLVILAGGNVSVGWDRLKEQRMRDWLRRCRDLSNSLMVGVSAGAIHMARGKDPEQAHSVHQHFLNWLPFNVAVHEEREGWPSLEGVAGIGIPLGGGVWVEAEAPTQLTAYGNVFLNRMLLG